jgi:hypothetical protein
MKELDHVFLVFGRLIEKDFSNVKSLTTKTIPNIGEVIRLKKGTFRVVEKLVDYRQVEDYNELEDVDRGGELVYLFLNELITG